MKMFALMFKHVFVATKLWSRQNWYWWQLPPVIDSAELVHSLSKSQKLSTLERGQDVDR